MKENKEYQEYLKDKEYQEYQKYLKQKTRETNSKTILFEVQTTLGLIIIYLLYLILQDSGIRVPLLTVLWVVHRIGLRSK